MHVYNVSAHPTGLVTSKQVAFGLASLASVSSMLVQAGNFTLGPSTFTAPGVFPTSIYSSYYNSPTATREQVQPVISDPVSHKIYPEALTSPHSIPKANKDPHPLPPKASTSLIVESAFEQVVKINENTIFNSSCTKCIASLEIVKFVALAVPEQVPRLMIRLCERFKLSSTCEETYTIQGPGSAITQVIANADVGGHDGQLFCQNFFSACPLPPTSPLNLTHWFAKPKPNPLPHHKRPSGKRLKILHISDIHLDFRYATGSEANCTENVCCRANNPNPSFPHAPSFPAPRFGALLCDTPFALALAALQAIPVLSGTEETGFAFTVYTGDLVSHDSPNELSQEYVQYTETVVYDLFKRLLGSGPVYATLGNHDTYNEAQDAPHSIGGKLAAQFSWNYDHVAALWGHEKWIPEGAVRQARAHYGAYSVQRQDGLRIITLNTDMWYRTNYFNYINTTNSDNSNMLRFLTDELQDAEDIGDRVWILGHVLSGWDGENPMMNPTNLFYQIVDRFSPHVIANMFFGHTHEDQFSIFYSNNGTNASAESAGTVSWIGPSITSRSNLNSGFRIYEVDSATFDILDAYTWYSNVSAYPSLDSQTMYGPTYLFEYSTREAYGADIKGWRETDPLNATWWHHITNAMLKDPSLMTKFTNFQGKRSVHTVPCETSECVEAKVSDLFKGDP